jgi:hypothetical protein
MMRRPAGVWGGLIVGVTAALAVAGCSEHSPGPPPTYARDSGVVELTLDPIAPEPLTDRFSVHAGWVEQTAARIDVYFDRTSVPLRLEIGEQAGISGLSVRLCAAYVGANKRNFGETGSSEDPSLAFVVWAVDQDAPECPTAVGASD